VIAGMGGDINENAANGEPLNSGGRNGGFSEAFSADFDRFVRSEGTQNPNLEDLKRTIKDAELSGAVVMIDMTASTDLKMAREFPDWVPHLLKFNEIISEVFPPEDFPDRKFLGDAYMFFIFTEDIAKKGNYGSRKCYSPVQILAKCREIMSKHWDYYRIYSDKKRGSKKPVAFREITCAVDYGKEIIDTAAFFSSQGSILDPVGTPVDRCFRISSIAAPGQLLLSEEFFNLLKKEDRENIAKISIAPEVLKGFPDVTNVYYSIPEEDVIQHILHENQVELVEKTKSMAAKVKIKLLRKALNKAQNASSDQSSAEGEEHENT
jgi:hypothetical protein